MTSIKTIIIKYLEDNYGSKFCWGGVLARAIHDQTGTKESVVERRARELVKSGVLEAVYDQVDGKGAKCVRYRVSPTHTFDNIMGNPLKELDKLTIRTKEIGSLEYHNGNLIDKKTREQVYPIKQEQLI